MKIAAGCVVVAVRREFLEGKTTVRLEIRCIFFDFDSFIVINYKLPTQQSIVYKYSLLYFTCL